MHAQRTAARAFSSAVPQETLLFNDTIACHIGYERSDKRRVRSVVADAAA